MMRVRRELDLWAAAGRHATFWWRDDDARALTPELERLLALAGRHRAAIGIAVIPVGARPDLVARLRGTPHRVFQHGLAHLNHAPPGFPKAELGPDRPTGVMLGELARGRDVLGALFGEAPSVLVPPHNRITPALARALPLAGFGGLSTYGRKPRAVPGLAWIDTQIDLINWTETRGFIGVNAAEAAIVGDLARRRADDFAGPPTGILTHHLAHDEATWDFLAAWLDLVAAHEAARLTAPAVLFGGP